ncbi:HDIG domain-containing protein [Synechococcales cyanobacterium C]|uniref:HDIG domain-containing protein n=1 Tax=Petrachloros mirabilis ULC683 TaxID=2781853 RepID=A0A8K1ZZN5_9CYAN|nr:HDIG domain-containing protein [Petrachloros mirabilis ULC683]
MAGSSIVLLTGVVGHSFYNEPRLAPGRPAPQTIRAPASTSVEDPYATEEARRQARQETISLFMRSQTATDRIRLSLEATLSQVRDVRQAVGAFPFVTPEILSTPVQHYLRQAATSDLEDILASSTSGRTLLASPSLAQQAREQLQAYRDAQRAVFDHRTSNPTELNSQIRQAQQRYQRALRTADAALPNSQLQDALSLSDADWQEAEQQIRLATSRMLVQGIPPGLPLDTLREAIKLQLSDAAPATQALGVHLLSNLLRANLIIDFEGTKRQENTAAEAVTPIRIEIQQGDLIVQAGETITQADFVLLEHFKLSRRQPNWLGLLGTTGLVSIAVGGVWWVSQHTHQSLSRRDYVLLLLLSLSSPLVVWSTGSFSYASLPAVGMLVGSFYGSILGATVVLLLSALMPLALVGGWIELAAVASASLVGAMVAHQTRSREDLALVGVIVAVTQGLVALVLLGITGVGIYVALGTALRLGLVGMGWGVVALGISPYLEHVFDLVTPIRLAELANSNRPMLKRLATDAPGTFQHTLLVATLAEAGARALGCNVELVRTGALYHDIGKLHDPEGFIENQFGLPNKHDQINDPWRSAALIKKHVTEGLVMARKCRLPTAVRAFIPEHQGSMVIAYFYHQAQQQAVADPEMPPVQEADFRYDGPTPQSRETGIVMLADSCEAALRSLKEENADIALQMIKKIFKARWQDNQLLDAGLTRDDLKLLADVFVKVWLQFHHKRISYPAAQPTPLAQPIQHHQTYP